MNFFGQRDKRWAHVCVGKTNRNLASIGCTTCCIADTTSWFGIEANPVSLAQRLNYTVDAFILWDSLLKVGLKLKQRFDDFNKAVIAAGLKDPNTTVLLNVANGGHWVFALRSIPFTNSYLVHDPWDSRKKIYGGVVGGAIISRK